MSTTNTLAREALHAYRHVLRATTVAFQGDTRMLLAARQRLRQGMENPQQEQDKGKEKLSPQGQVQLLEDIAMFLRHNVVQGKRVVANDTEQYHLNIHKDTELGDNDTVKTGKVDTKLRGREWKRGDTNTGCGNGGK